MIRVLLIDDQPLIRSGFRALLAVESDVEVIAEAGDGISGLELTRLHRPDVVLVDIQMPGLDGLELTRRIVADPELRSAHVVILTNYGLDEYVYEALRAGATGFLVKDMEPEDFLHAVRVAARGDALLAPTITRTLIERFTSSARPRPFGAPVLLTDREQEAVTLVGRGLTNSQVASRMVISPHTAKTHINRAMAKVGARDRAQLVVFAYENGLVHPGNPDSGAARAGGSVGFGTTRTGTTRAEEDR